MKDQDRNTSAAFGSFANPEQVKHLLIWVAAPIIVLATMLLAAKVLGSSKVINARWNSAILPSGTKIELKSVVRKMGDSFDPNRKRIWTPDGLPISASTTIDESCQSAAPDIMDASSYGPQETRYLTFHITSPTPRELEIHGFIPNSEFQSSNPTRNGTCRCAININLDEGGNASFEALVASKDSKLRSYVLELSDTDWTKFASMASVQLEGKHGEKKDIDFQGGKLRLSVFRYSEYSGPERHPDYVHIEVAPTSSTKLSEYRILLYDTAGALLQFPYGLKRMPMPNQCDFPIDLWNSVRRIDIEKRSTEFVEFSNISMNPR